jgi:nucleoside-diphosphate-sugar epimerase
VGLEVFKKLLKSKKSVDVVGIVRSKWSARALRRIGATPEQIRVADIRDKDAVKAAFSGISNCKVVMCTGSKTRRKLFSLAKAAVWKVALKDYKVKPKDLYYRDGERPYVYDYGGTKNCVDAALTARCEQFVLLSWYCIMLFE